MISSVRAVTFGRQYIDLMLVECLEQRLVIPELDHFGLDRVFIQESLQHLDHRAVEHADLPSVQARKAERDIGVRIVLDQAVRLIAHRGVRIADEILAVFPVCKSREKIYLAVQEHLVEIAEFTVNVFIAPACIFRKLLVVFICVSGLYRTFLRAFLENLILIVSDTHGRALAFCI